MKLQIGNTATIIAILGACAVTATSGLFDRELVSRENVVDALVKVARAVDDPSLSNREVIELALREVPELEGLFTRASPAAKGKGRGRHRGSKGHDSAGPAPAPADQGGAAAPIAARAMPTSESKGMGRLKGSKDSTAHTVSLRPGPVGAASVLAARGHTSVPLVPRRALKKSIKSGKGKAKVKAKAKISLAAGSAPAPAAANTAGEAAPPERRAEMDDLYIRALLEARDFQEWDELD